MFAALDCFSEPLARVIPPSKLAQPFDVVSMQYCMHYTFESEARARCMLENVTAYLHRGGIFVGTIPNAELLLMRPDQIPADASELSFGNSVYSIRIAGATTSLRSQVFLPLQDAVEDVPEYVVRWDNFVR